jgi:hypothetical protein
MDGFLISEDMKRSLPKVSDNVSGRGCVRHPFSILVTYYPKYPNPKQIRELWRNERGQFDSLEEFARQFVSPDKIERVDYGQEMMSQYELRQALYDILNKFMVEDNLVTVEIRHAGEYGFVELDTLVYKEFENMHDLKQRAAESVVFREELNRYFPEFAFDGDGDFSFWVYGHSTCLNYNFANNDISRGTDLLKFERRNSLQDKGKERYVADLVNFMFTWVEQEEKNRYSIPLSFTDIELKIFVEADAADNSISRTLP